MEEKSPVLKGISAHHARRQGSGSCLPVKVRVQTEPAGITKKCSSMAGICQKNAKPPVKMCLNMSFDCPSD
jgi:hypothetical protein